MLNPSVCNAALNITSNNLVGRNTSKDDARIDVCGGTRRRDSDGDGDSIKCNFISVDTKELKQLNAGNVQVLKTTLFFWAMLIFLAVLHSQVLLMLSLERLNLGGKILLII